MTIRSGSAFSGYRFPDEVIALAVRWYLRFRLSYADVVELLAERGISVDPSTVYDWVRIFTPHFIEPARAYRSPVGRHWRVDETYIKIGKRWHYLGPAQMTGYVCGKKYLHRRPCCGRD